MKDLCLKNKIIFEEVMEENKIQIDKWGIQDHDPADWLMFTTEELGELSEAIADWKFREAESDNVVKEAIQVATLALKIAEMFLNHKD